MREDCCFQSALASGHNIMSSSLNNQTIASVLSGNHQSPPASSTTTTTTTPTRKSNKCSVEGCTDRPVKIIGDCRYCNSKYCSRHRLPEAHACVNLQSCRDESISRLNNKLMSEKTVAAKIR
ncbi:hypothetical protein SeLEV6574_g02738 [Synchytrium endobioticum]|uniref:AN1-type domain-containing protein n=1 Tax=Synchytrium endobioticum TaxID=286115 RepID=A0A507D6Z0_9FUNG|nr:hypothetical protein SeLEV6574_g02738 [Synchytrium endobioticum]